MKNVFDYKSPNFEKLVSFGFMQHGKTYTYAVKILEGQFEVRVVISNSGAVKTETVDLETDEPFTLHLVEDAEGAFIGAVRTEYEQVLTDIADACFETDIFRSDLAHRIIKYVRDRYGDEPEYLWKKFPSNAVWRRHDNKKWYGILLLLSKRKLGMNSDEVIEIIDLRTDPEILPELIDGKRYFPGYHMNKKSWLTIPLDGAVPAEEIFERIDRSYALAEKR